jgi:hypothetical protein
MPSTNTNDEQIGLDTGGLLASTVVSTGVDRMLAAEQWLSAAATDPAVARDQWARDGAALLRCDSLFAAIRIPSGIVHSAAGTSDPETLSEVLTTLLGGPVFVDLRGGHFYALVEAGAARRWAVQGTACLSGPGMYLGVPAATCTKATSEHTAYWVVLMDRPGTLCNSLDVVVLVRAGRAAHEREQAADA